MHQISINNRRNCKLLLIALEHKIFFNDSRIVLLIKMPDGERDTEFEDIFKQMCTKLEVLRKEYPPPKKTINKIIGPIVDDIFKIHEDETYIQKWEKQPPDFSIEEQIIELENDVYTWLTELYTNGFISEDLVLLGQSAAVHPTLILRFLYDYLYKQETYEFNKKRFTSIWNKLMDLDKAEKLESFIRIPLCNFYLLDKKLSRDNICCRLVNLVDKEQYYFLIQLLGEQPLINLGSMFSSVNPNAKLGLLVSHVFEFKYEYTKEQKKEYMEEYMKALLTGPVFIEGAVHLSKEILFYLETLNNPRIQNLVDSARQIEKYLEMALQIFKKGDVRIFGMLEEGTFNNQIIDQALFSLEKKDFSKLRIPYSMNKVEFHDFLDFWADFYPQVIKTHDYDDVITILYDAQSDEYDSIFFNYFKALEILFANDSTDHRQKSKTFRIRSSKFFTDHHYPSHFSSVVASLKKIRNQKAHEGFVDSQKIDDLGLIIFQSRHVEYMDIYQEVKDILRTILKDFWLLLKPFSYDETKLRTHLDS